MHCHALKAVCVNKNKEVETVNIIACVKQVPDTEAQIKVKADGTGIEEGQIK